MYKRQPVTIIIIIIIYMRFVIIIDRCRVLN